MKLQVLDKGYVELVDYMGTDLAPLESARMSTSNPTGVDVVKDDGLRRRLWRDNHTSPFESVEMVVEIKCPMFVLRQLDRHRTISALNLTIEGYDDFRKFTSRNEFSGRYAVFPDEFYVPSPERFKKKGSLSNKQGSGDALSPEDQSYLSDRVGSLVAFMEDAFRTMEDMNVSNEVARMVHPGMIYTKIRLKTNGLNWLKFFNLRLRSDVQEETRLFVETIARFFRSLFPKMWDVFEEETLYGSQVSRSQAKLIRYVLSDYLRQDGVEEAEFNDVQKVLKHLQEPEISEIPLVEGIINHGTRMS